MKIINFIFIFELYPMKHSSEYIIRKNAGPFFWNPKNLNIYQLIRLVLMSQTSFKFLITVFFILPAILYCRSKFLRFLEILFSFLRQQWKTQALQIVSMHFPVVFSLHFIFFIYVFFCFCFCTYFPIKDAWYSPTHTHIFLITCHQKYHG